MELFLGVTKKNTFYVKIFRRMLAYFYIYLKNGKVETIMNKPIVKCMISDILNYFLKYRHDAHNIQQQLINEEKEYVGILYNARKKYDTLLKKNKDCARQQIREVYGISDIIIDNIDILKFIKY